jgi:hypothetical protein
MNSHIFASPVDSCSVPAQMLYVTTFEWIKQQLRDTPFSSSRNFVAGLLSSVVSNVITTPMDVISQRQMVVEGVGGGPKYVSGLDVARRILSVHGPRGLYRGFVVSVRTAAFRCCCCHCADTCLSAGADVRPVVGRMVGGACGISRSVPHSPC